MLLQNLAPGELRTLPLNILRNIDFKSREEEEEVQGEINRRLIQSPTPLAPVQLSNSITDNFGKPGYPTEAEAQAEIDAKQEAYRTQLEAHNNPTEETVEAAPVDEALLEAKIEELQEEVKVIEEELKPKFCEFCDSKGVRHKKECTRVIG